MIVLDYDEARKLEEKWVSNRTEDMRINERVYVLEKIVRRLMKEVEGLKRERIKWTS